MFLHEFNASTLLNILLAKETQGDKNERNQINS
jgi:hypothetical protein